MDEVTFHLKQSILCVGPCKSYVKSNALKDHCLDPGKLGSRASIELLNITIKQEIHMQRDHLNLCTNYKLCLHA